jgi:hypothetical protein
MATKAADMCLDTTVRCIEACERCAVECGTSGDVAREKCALLARDCADIASLSLAMMSRGSQYYDEICEVHAKACDACVEMCARFPQHRCCVECLEACRACAETCRACAA